MEHIPKNERVFRKGRPPKGSAGNLRSEILHAAETLFLRDGYAATSVERIALQMRSSKRTIYDIFPSKIELLAAVFDRVIGRALENLQEVRPGMGPFESRLKLIGQRLLAFAVIEENVAVYRLLASEAYRLPGLPQMIQREIVEPLFRHVEEVFETAASKGEIADVNRDAAARQFVEFVWSQELRRMMIGLDQPGLTSERFERLDEAVDLFSRAYARPAADA